MDVGRLDLPVDALLFRRQMIEIHLRGGRQGLDDVLEGVTIKPVPQVENLDRYLRIRQKQREKVALLQVLAHRIIIGEVAVVDQGFVEPVKGWAPPGCHTRPLVG